MTRAVTSNLSRKLVGASILIGALLPLLAAPAAATTVVRMDQSEMVERSEFIFHGTCLSKRSHVVDSGDLVVTTYRFEVTEMLKGQLPTSNIIEITQPGGIVGTRGTYIAGMAPFTPGEEVVCFWAKKDRSDAPFSMPVGLRQGKYRVFQDAKTGSKRVQRTLEGLEIFDPSTRRLLEGGELEEEPLPLHDFLDEIRKQQAQQQRK